MNVCIVTVYNSENCGSFLQAYSLAKYIQSLGHEVFFLKRPVSGTSHSEISILIEKVKCYIKGNINQVKLIDERHKSFSNQIKSFNVIGINDALKTMNCFVIGSDTLWDFSDSYFRKNYELYVGKYFGDRFFTYAVSCANTTEEDINKINIDLSGVKKARGIGVRDKATQNLVSKITGCKCDLVLDPTMLVDCTAFEQFAKDVIKFKYILIYSFGIIQEGFKDQIIQYAAKYHLKIVSIGTYLSWADVVVAASPEQFVQYYKQASFVVTNTFHGTLFAIIFNKQFVAITKKKNKINEIIELLGIEEYATDTCDEVYGLFDNKIDYNKVNSLIRDNQQHSMFFIDDMLKKKE